MVYCSVSNKSIYTPLYKKLFHILFTMSLWNIISNTMEDFEQTPCGMIKKDTRNRQKKQTLPLKGLRKIWKDKE